MNARFSKCSSAVLFLIGIHIYTISDKLSNAIQIA